MLQSSNSLQFLVCDGKCLLSGCVEGTTDNCCHEQCLAGCSEPNSTRSCYACRYYRNEETSECVKACPKGFYKVMYSVRNPATYTAARLCRWKPIIRRQSLNSWRQFFLNACVCIFVTLCCFTDLLLLLLWIFIQDNQFKKCYIQRYIQVLFYHWVLFSNHEYNKGGEQVEKGGSSTLLYPWLMGEG